MGMFYRVTDWAELWEDWYLSLSPDGSYKYKSIKFFALAHGKSKQQRIFLRWYLGPNLDGDQPTPYPAIPSVHSQDWAKRRRDGGWFTEDNLKKFGSEIRRRVNALEALREAGGITLQSLIRAEQMALQIDKAFNGQMFIGGAAFEVNLHRAKSYIALQAQVQELKEKAQDMFAKSHGLNFNDMAGLTALMTAGAMNTQRDSQSQGERALSAVVRMALEKAKKYDLELPPGSVEAIVDEEEKVVSRKKVQ
jgi:hypothetical protein